MKKILMMAILCLVFTTSGFAQFKRSAFNHVGLNAGVGTEGISIGVAAPSPISWSWRQAWIFCLRCSRYLTR